MQKIVHKRRCLFAVLLLCIVLLCSFLAACSKSPTIENPPDDGADGGLPSVVVPLNASYSDDSSLFNCDPHIEFQIYDEGSVSVTNSNLYSHIVVTDRRGNWIEIGIEATSGRKKTVFTTPEGYIPGETYSITLGDGVFFVGHDAETRAITFAIAKEETFIIELNSGIRFISMSSVISMSEDLITVDSGEYSIGEIVTVGDNYANALTQDTPAFKINNILNNGSSIDLFIERPSIKEIYDKIELYSTQEMNYDAVDWDSMDYEQMEAEVGNSAAFYDFQYAVMNTYAKLQNSAATTQLATSTSQSSGISFDFEPWKIDNPKFSFSPGKLGPVKFKIDITPLIFDNRKDSNFKTKYGIDTNGGMGLQVVLSASFPLEEIGIEKVTIKMSFDIFIRVQMTLNASAPENELESNTSTKTILYTKMKLDILFQPKSTQFDGKTNVDYQKEWSDLISKQLADEYKLMNYWEKQAEQAIKEGKITENDLNNIGVLKGLAIRDYLEAQSWLFNRPSLQGFTWRLPFVKNVPLLVIPTPIPLAISMELGIFVNLNLQLEIQAECEGYFTLIGGAQATELEQTPYMNPNAAFQFNSLSICGKMAIRAGVYFNIGIGIPFTGVEIGVSVEAGFYANLTGKAVLKNDDGLGATIGGSWHFEGGIYASFGGYWKVDWWIIKFGGSFLTVNLRIPLLSLGQESIWLDFYNGDKDPFEVEGNKTEVEMKSRFQHLDVSDCLTVRRYSLRTMDFDFYLPDYSELDISFEKGGIFEYSDGNLLFVSTDRTQTYYTDTLVISLKEHPECYHKIIVSYLNTIALDAIKIDEHGAVYELIPSDLTYSLKSGPSGVQNYAVKESIERLPVVAIQNNAFAGNRTIKKITLHSDIKTIGDYAFYGCAALIEMDLRDVTSLGSNAFSGCRSLNYVLLGNLTAINISTFENCTSLVAIDLPTSLKTIEDSAFLNTGLNSIVIPSGVTNMGNAAFGNSGALNLAYFKGSMPTFSGNPFLLCNMNFYVIAPAAAHASYLGYFADYGISVGTDANVVGDFVIAIDGGSCVVKYYFGTQSDVVVPSILGGKTVVMIGQRAFGNQVETLVLPSTIQGIDSFAFREARNLVSITLNTTIPPILGGMVFANGNSALTVYVPQNSLQAYTTSPYWTTWAAIDGFLRTQK